MRDGARAVRAGCHGSSPRGVLRRAALLIVPAALLGGCGQLVVIPSGAENAVRQLVSTKTSTRAVDVSCPSGVSAKVGTTFDCHFKTPDGTKYVAHMRIASVHGKAVNFQINTAALAG
jgi:hypothetical protein